MCERVKQSKKSFSGFSASLWQAPVPIGRAASLDVQPRGQDQRERWRHSFISVSPCWSADLWPLTRTAWPRPAAVAPLADDSKGRPDCHHGAARRPEGPPGAQGHVRSVTAPRWVPLVPSGASPTALHPPTPAPHPNEGSTGYRLNCGAISSLCFEANQQV